MSVASPERRVTFLFDVDNTLIDNDRAKKDLSSRIAELLGVAGEQRFWELYEEVRHDRGLVNIPLLLARYGDELDADPSLAAAERRRLRFALADLVMGFPYGEYLYPGAMDAVRKARTLGQVAVLSEGDATFQPHKIWRTGLDPEVDGNVLVFDRKLDHLDEMTAAFPADHYVLVEDKPEILKVVKRILGPRVTTILVRQGKYGQAALLEGERPDLVFDSIGALADSDFSLLDGGPDVARSQRLAAPAKT
ncbi:MAG TPA: HAD family hydrolase [Thermomicrobiales bacterium]|nr:HAD family hydrolase [Thermomicrobiales bacterium]